MSKKLGLSELTKAVKSNHSQHVLETEPNANEVKEKWENYGNYPNAVRLIEYLGRDDRIDQLGGSDTIELKDLVKGNPRLNQVLKDELLNIGIPVLRISPIRWFWLLEMSFDSLPCYLIDKLDRVCGAILRMIQSTERPGGEK